MTTLGWLFLVLSLTFVWGLTIWCFYQVLTVSDHPGPGDAESLGDGRAHH